MLKKRIGSSVTVLNDADAAGLAEVRFGAASQEPGVVLLLTLGTGVGSALFVGGRLVPNTELGSLYLKNQKKRSELKAASAAKKSRGLTWREYAKDLNDYLVHVNRLFSPDLIVIGGGVSRKHEKFFPFLADEVGQKIVPATMGNNAGIVGAALAAAEAQEKKDE
jgi:polyphosphate glucokinase